MARKKRLLPITSVWFLRMVLAIQLVPIQTYAGLIPESVLLVVNADRPASLSVANEYARLRQIPSINIVTLSNVTNTEQLSVDEFRSQILSPVLKAIEDRGLRSQIQCVAYSADLPTAIHVNDDIGDRRLPQILTPVASINGLTFLNRLTMAKDIRYLDLNSNRYAKPAIAKERDTAWNSEEQKRYAEALQAFQAPPPQQHSGPAGEQPADALQPLNDPARLTAIDVLLDLKRAHPGSAELLYNIACSLAAVDRINEALATLKEAVGAGWLDHRHTIRDPDLKLLRHLPEFKTILDQMKAMRLEIPPARGFGSDGVLELNGSRATEDVAPRYLLSTVLGVTTGRGSTVAEVIANLQRSASADGTRPQGTVYFLRNGDIRSTTREWGFESAVNKLKSLGINALIEDGVLPQSKNQVAGAMIGIADFDWSKCGSSILPGAIVEHLTSFGGVMTAGAGQTPLTEFLRHGAAGSSGTVTEPFAIQAKFPAPFIHVHYACGCTLAEAFYQSVTGPYQLLIVGDPLCNPWRRDFSVVVQTPSTDKPWHGTIVLTSSTTSIMDLTATEFCLFVDGKRLVAAGTGKEMHFDTTKSDDGEHQIAVTAKANDGVETYGRWMTNISIQNHPTERLLSLTGSVDPDHPFDKPIPLEAACPEATEIAIMHFDRVVAKINGAKGRTMIEPNITGSGTVSLQPVAAFADGRQYRGQPITIQIPHPPSLSK